MNYWIFVATPQTDGTASYSSREIYLRRMKDAFWGLGERTPHRRNVRQGDQVVFYVGRPECAFAGTARLRTASFALTTDQQADLAHGSTVFTVEHGVNLEAIDVWDASRPVSVVAPQLSFIENPTNWGAYFQGGVRQVSEADYGRIVSGFAEGATAVPAPETPASQAIFALEAHLEEFIARNWQLIPWGASLRLFRDGDQSGRQYPAGVWSIDFLAVDEVNRDLVVIELKRGKTSDSTVGQLLRYINWVRENVALAGQNVRGIIIASEVDDALRYAAKGLPGVSVQTYRVQFELNGVQL